MQDLPPVMGPYAVNEFYSDNGGICHELVYVDHSLVDDEFGAKVALTGLAGLLNAAGQAVYELDKEMKGNNGKYPERLSTALATSVDILLRSCVNFFRPPCERCSSKVAIDLRQDPNEQQPWLRWLCPQCATPKQVEAAKEN